MEEKRNTSIQALRGISFLIIFLYHAEIFPRGGGLGVSIFFVLSGFLLMQRNMNNQFVLSINNNAKFAIKKIKKLYFLHISMLIIAFPLYYVRKATDTNFLIDLGKNIFLNVFLMQSWFPEKEIRYSINPLSWFLSTLCFLYFMFPIVQTKIVKANRKKLMHYYIIILVLMVAYAYLMNRFFINGYIDVDILQGLIYNHPIYRFGDFLLGCILGAIYYHHESNGYSPMVLTIIEIALLCVLCYCVAVDWNRYYFNKGYPYIWWSVTCFAALSSFIVWIFFKKGGAITSWLAHSWFVDLGNISNYMYLIHELIIIYTGIVLKKTLNVEISGFLLYLRAIIAIVLTGVGAMLWRCFMKKLGNRCTKINMNK